MQAVTIIFMPDIKVTRAQEIIWCGRHCNALKDKLYEIYFTSSTSDKSHLLPRAKLNPRVHNLYS